VPEASLGQDNTNREAESQQSDSDHNEAALREGSSLGSSFMVDNLNKRILLCFVEFGSLEIAYEGVEDRLVVFRIPQLPDVFETSFGSAALGHNKLPESPFSDSPSFASCAHALQLLQCLHHIAVLTGCAGLYSLNLHFARRVLSVESRCRQDQGMCGALELDHAREAN